MKQLGSIDISFKNYADGIYYYDVLIQIGENKRVVILPRYDAFLGWIEVFGLPPQNEWCVLDDFDDFSKEAILVIDSKEIKESVRYIAGDNTHTIQTDRQIGNVIEKSTWQQDYRNAPDSMTSEVIFEHVDGKYETKWGTKILTENSSLTSAEQLFVANRESVCGKPDLLIKKTFSTSGVLPSIYYSLFPIEGLIDLKQTSGSVVEMGYLRNDSPHKVDRVHGDWYKRFDFGDKVFYVNETNYSSCDQETDQGTERIKDTYRKELFIE